MWLHLNLRENKKDSLEHVMNSIGLEKCHCCPLLSVEWENHAERFPCGPALLFLLRFYILTNCVPCICGSWSLCVGSANWSSGQNPPCHQSLVSIKFYWNIIMFIFIFTYLWLLSLCNGRHEKLLDYMTHKAYNQGWD